jgi:DtxR family Mn-dependent transcriptional regulator
MVPSHTVENYLKAIYQAQTRLTEVNALVPMGQLASALGVVPGTATTMVKALAESGLVRYEPYAGVRLTKAGEKLAALVLRRHRLVELFLVKVMGMSWTEVHDEAELLEHAVSDRLIDRIDEMLGRPEVDPHGDPIPSAEGTVARPTYDTLLTCPLHQPMRVSRVSDQDREFLEFIERHDLKPGALVEVAERDAAADSVRVKGSREFTIGARAASKVLVRAAGIVLLLLSLGRSAEARQQQPFQPATEPFRITDNSFLVEEAFNQEAGIFQNIFNAARADHAWSSTFTQEWPLGSQTHQFSYTLAWVNGGGVELGATLLNYRYQAMLEGPGRPACSPRLSLVLPTGTASDEDVDATGLQVNLPFSKQVGDVYWHWNAGMTWFPSAGTAGGKHSFESPFLAGSAIVRLHPMFHAMLETVLNVTELPSESGTRREELFTLSPGVRGGWDIGDQQLIFGLAIPMTWGAGRQETAGFIYASYELPFKK